MRKAIVGLAVMGMLAGCSSQKAGYTAGAGSVAVSRDGLHVYAIDTDNDELEVVDAQTLKKVQSVKTGHRPARVLVGPDETIYVSNRGDRTVSAFSGADFSQTQVVPVGVEPVGLALNADGDKLYVVSATGLDDATHGTLTELDTATLKTDWVLPVGEEPRGVAVVGEKAYVTSLKKGTVTVVDLRAHEISTGVDLSSPSSADPKLNPGAMSPGGVVDVTPSPDGSRVYAPHLWELVGPIQPDSSVVMNGGGGGGSYGGPPATPGCDGTMSGGSIVAAGLATITVASDKAETDPVGACDSSTPGANQAKDYPPSVLGSFNQDGNVVQAPSAAVVDPSGLWLFVVNRSSDNLVVMPTHSRSLNDGLSRLVVRVGAGPDGIALSQDGQTAYVYAQFDHKLSVIRQGEGPGGTVLSEVRRVSLAGDTLPADEVAGRKMFFSATNANMTAQSIGISCSSCHLEGREDGHVWQFPDGPRQTPDLAGRKLQETAPYHWAGLFPKLDDFYRETVVGRMGGAGLQPEDASKLTAFIESMPAPENPFVGRPDLLDAQNRGRQAFEKAGCIQCHTGEAMTDNGLHNVGTLSAADRLEILTNGIEDSSQLFPQLQAVNTPSLIALARSAPYLHDGSVQTLRERILQARHPRYDGTDHGDTSMLSDQEIDDLEQYLRTL